MAALTAAGRNQAAAEQVEKPLAGLDVRQAAAKLLAAVIDKKTSLDGLLDNAHGAKAGAAFNARDKALLRALLIVALRHRGAIAAKLAQLLQKPLPQGARALEHILHIGAAQILYLDVPNHAAIDLAAESAKRNPQTKRFVGLVNAVLRRLSQLAKTPQAEAGDSAADAVPPWFWQMLLADYGARSAAAIVAAQACLPPLDISVKATPQLWAERLGAKILPFGTLRLAAVKTSVPDLPGFAEGAWWVQNAAASLPARLMGDVRGKRVADLCAAPGGKTAQLAAAGANVTAADISASRLARLSDNMRRLGLTVDIWQGDMRQMAKAEGFQPFDAALLDAPCSSTGTARRHPDILWTKSPADSAALARVQADLLAHSLALVKRGGMVLFCNCSLAKQEGEELIAAFLRDHKDTVKLLPFTAAEMQALIVAGAAEGGTKADCAGLITAEGFLRTTPADLPDKEPHFAGMDGFFAARLQKL